MSHQKSKVTCTWPVYKFITLIPYKTLEFTVSFFHVTARKHDVNCKTAEIFKSQYRKLSQLVLAPRRAAASVYCEFHFHSSRLIIAFSAHLFFISIHVQFHVAEAKREKRTQPEKPDNERRMESILSEQSATVDELVEACIQAFGWSFLCCPLN